MSGLPMLPIFPAHVGPDHPMATITDIPGVGSGPTSGCEESSVANFQLFYFPQFPCALAAISVEPLHSTGLLITIPDLFGVYPEIIKSLNISAWNTMV